MNEFRFPPVYESLRIVANEESDCVGVTRFMAQKTHNLKYLWPFWGRFEIIRWYSWIGKHLFIAAKYHLSISTGLEPGNLEVFLTKW